MLRPFFNRTRRKIKHREGSGRFFNSALGTQLIKLANLRVKHIEDQNILVETKIDGLNERLELNKVLLDELTETRKLFSDTGRKCLGKTREQDIN